MAKEKATITPEELGLNPDIGNMSIKFQEVSVPMRPFEERVNWLKRFRLKPISINITTVKDYEDVFSRKLL